VYREVGGKEQSKPHLIINRYEDNLTRYNLFEFTNKAEAMLPTIEKYSGHKSKRVGQIMLNADGGSSKPWECYILLDEKAPLHALVHELIHSCSASHFGARIFAANRWEEELRVHYLSQELASLEKIPVVDSGYDDGVALIREFKTMSGGNMTDLEFASELIKQPLGERWDWLWEQISAKMNSGADLETGTRLMSKLEAIKRWMPKEPPE